MCYEEDKEAEVDLNLVMNDAGEIIEIQGTAENEPFSKAQLVQMVDAGAGGIRLIISAQRKVLGTTVAAPDR